MAETVPLAEVLHRMTREGELCERHPDGSLTCFACGHRCLIRPGREGVCRIRYNRDGILRVPHGYVGSLAVDPIEKKPFFHALPGSLALSFGMLGCDFHCAFCQNWITSQTIRDPGAAARPEVVSAADLAALAGEARRADPGLHLQRAPHHQRVGRGDLPGGAEEGASGRLRLQRERHRRRSSSTCAPGSISTRWT